MTSVWEKRCPQRDMISNALICLLSPKFNYKNSLKSNKSNKSPIEPFEAPTDVIHYTKEDLQ